MPRGEVALVPHEGEVETSGIHRQLAVRCLRRLRRHASRISWRRGWSEVWEGAGRPACSTCQGEVAAVMVPARLGTT